MTRTRKKSSARVQFCYIQGNGFNSTMMRKFGSLSGGGCVSQMQRSWIPNDVNSLGSQAQGRPRSEEEGGLLPWLLRARPPQLSSSLLPTPIFPVGGPNLTFPCPGRGPGLPPWVSWLSPVHHLKTQHMHHSIPDQGLASERREPSASSLGLLAKNARSH